MCNSVLQGDEKKVWDAFRLVSTNFLRNFRADIYKELIEDMLSLYNNNIYLTAIGLSPGGSGFKHIY